MSTQSKEPFPHIGLIVFLAVAPALLCSCSGYSRIEVREFADGHRVEVLSPRAYEYSRPYFYAVTYGKRQVVPITFLELPMIGGSSQVFIKRKDDMIYGVARGSTNLVLFIYDCASEESWPFRAGKENMSEGRAKEERLMRKLRIAEGSELLIAVQ